MTSALVLKLIIDRAQKTIPGPSKDVLGSVTKFTHSLELWGRLRAVTLRIMHLLKEFDPVQYQELLAAQEKLKEINPGYPELAEIDGSFFHGRSLIFNRATQEHTDRRDPKFAWTPLLTLGAYTKGKLRVCNLEIDYMPGTLVLIRGGSLRHSVTFEGGQRVCIAHFLHTNVLKDVGLTNLKLTAIPAPNPTP